MTELTPSQVKQSIANRDAWEHMWPGKTKDKPKYINPTGFAQTQGRLTIMQNLPIPIGTVYHNNGPHQYTKPCKLPHTALIQTWPLSRVTSDLTPIALLASICVKAEAITWYPQVRFNDDDDDTVSYYCISEDAKEWFGFNTKHGFYKGTHYKDISKAGHLDNQAQAWETFNKMHFIPIGWPQDACTLITSPNDNPYHNEAI